MKAKELVKRYPALGRLGDLTPKKAIPYIAQHTVTDCGPTCLAMVLAYFGREVRIEELREAMGCGRDGVSAFAILEAARIYNLNARGVKVELKDLARLPRPAILHWGFDHFVIFDRVSGDRVHVVDPAHGARVL